MTRQILLTGVPPENLYNMRHFYDFDNEGKDVEWGEDLATGAAVVVSSGGGTGCASITTGGTANQPAAISGKTGASLIDDYEQRIQEAAFRIHQHETGTGKAAMLIGYGYLAGDPNASIAADCLSVNWTNREFAGFFKKADDPYWWCVNSSRNAGTSEETRSTFKVNESEGQTKQGWQTLRVVVEDRPGDVSYIKYFIDVTGYGDWAPCRDESNQLIRHIRDESDPTSAYLHVVVNNATNAKQRVWIDWWSVNVPRAAIVTSGAIS